MAKVPDPRRESRAAAAFESGRLSQFGNVFDSIQQQSRSGAPGHGQSIEPVGDSATSTTDWVPHVIGTLIKR
jgi:hypothetical protein